MTRRRIAFNQASSVDEPTVNLTPLIDVVFVILIMFIVIAPLLELERIELAESAHSPSSATQSVKDSSPIAIHVHADNTLSFNGNSVLLSQLLDKLNNAKKQYPQITPQVFHDRRATFGTYQSVKNTLEEAGFSHVEIILKPV